MDIEVHGNEVARVITHVRDWLNANRVAGEPVLPGGRALREDYDAYLLIAADVVASLRLDPHDQLPHVDYLLVVERALPLIEAARRA